MIVIPVLIFDKHSRSFEDKILAPWQHCLSGYRVLIGKCMQLEKTDTARSKIGAAKSKRNPQKHLAHRQVPSQLWRALSNEMPAIPIFVEFGIQYKDDINIRNNYFTMV
jgi:hypothetical protein